jgi:hypothetical protein
MKMREVVEEMSELEARYHDLHRAGKSARLEIALAKSGSDRGMLSLLEWRLDDIEREKGEILRRVECIEDSLADDDEMGAFEDGPNETLVEERLIEDSLS